MATQLGGFLVGDRVVRRIGKTQGGSEVGVIVALVPAVERPYYAAHKAYARVRFEDRRRLGGSGYRHSNIQIDRLMAAPLEPKPYVDPGAEWEAEYYLRGMHRG